jgi:D-glycero-D-manno-heptose 1,7-bisphosphate phosphatase
MASKYEVFIQEFGPLNSKKILILDRDGTLNQDTGYEHRKENLHIIPEAISFLAKATKMGFGMILATNQGGAALNKFSIDQSLDFNSHLVARLAELDIFIAAAYICFHHPLSFDEEKRDCSCRKPKPGMLTRVLLDYELGSDSALMIGDQETDAEAAERAGIKFQKIGSPSLWDKATVQLEEF